MIPRQYSLLATGVIASLGLVYYMNSRFNVYLQKQIGDFLSANEKTLREFVEMAKATLEDRPVTLLVQGLEQYYRYRFEHFVHLRARLCNILRM